MSRPSALALVVALLVSVLLVGCGTSSAPVSQPSLPTQAYKLVVTPPASGTGTVTSTPPGINCPTTCSATFPQNTKVQLTPTPTANYFFNGWTGACSGTASCSLSMTGDENVSAAFSAGEQLTVSLSGNGTGTVTSTPVGINCPSTCSAAFPANTQVALTETPSTNDSFASWSGDCSGTTSCVLTLAATSSVTANFTAANSGGGNFSATAVVYVANATSGTNNEVQAFSADPSGQLTSVSGSPFQVNAAYMTATGKYLFTTDGTNIYSYSVASDGSITQASSINPNDNNASPCGSPLSLFLDRTGATLYGLDYVSDCANNQYEAFSIDPGTGALKFVGITTAASPVFNRPLSFLGDDQFGYSASCYHYIQEIYGFRRNSDGSLTLVSNLGGAPPMPEPPAGDTYCPWLAAADASNHEAVTLSAMNIYSFQADGATQIAVYTVDASGNLSTNSTSSDMPRVAVGNVTDMQMSPAGNYLAVAGTGLQVFNFNGANPVTQLTGLLTNAPIDQIAWDNANHLYAISKSANQLFVFTVSSTGADAAPGSPYTISSPVNIAVLPGS